MQNRPENWAAVFAVPHITEYRFLINGIEYREKDIQGTPAIERPLMQEPCIGRCCTGMLTLVIRQHENETIPKAAPVHAFCRLKARVGEAVTDWVDQGRYWISRRSASGGLTTLTCRDGMMLAGRTYLDKTQFIEWPVAMTEVFDEIVKLMGVEVDERTHIKSGAAYKVDYPNDDVLMSEVLSGIAAAHGGNFVMTASGKMRLIPYPDTQTPVQVIGQSYSRIKPLSTGQTTVSRVTLTDSANNQFTYGDDSGLELTANCEYATQEVVNLMCAGYVLENGKLHAPDGEMVSGKVVLSDDSTMCNGTITLSGDSIIGRSFIPYELTGAYLDPLVEVGDTVSIVRKEKEMLLVIGSIKVRCNKSYVCDLQHGVEDDDEDEVPYISAADLRAKRYITTTSSYFGNRINRTEGFVSELMENDEPIARMVANATRFSMQRKNGDVWEDCLYFDPVAKNYKFTGEVEISTLTEVSMASVTNNSLVFAADANGDTLERSYTTCVFAYTGEDEVLPTVTGVSGAPTGMLVSIGEAENNRIPITVSVPTGVNLGSTDSTSGVLTVGVTFPVDIGIEISWIKVNTGANGKDGSNGKDGADGAPGKDGANGKDGAPGKDGADGAPGADGVDGVTYYTWVKYADSPTSGMSDSPEGKVYIGIAYNQLFPEASENYSDYAWSLIKGANGANGYNNAVITLYQRAEANYLRNDGLLSVAPASLDNGLLVVRQTGSSLSNGTASLVALSAPVGETTFTFSTNLLSGDLGKWSRQIPDGVFPCYVTSATVSSIDDTVIIPASAWSEVVKLVENGVDGAAGSDAVTQYTWIKYADSPTSGMSDSPEGKTYMGIAYNRTTAVESTAYSDYSWSLIKGTDGIDGEDGQNGETYYTWVKYADDAQGNGMTDLPDGKYYIGLAYNKKTPKESSSAADYTWSLFRGSDGVDGTDGKDGANGKDGADGVDGYNATFVHLYKRADTTPATPGSTTLFTFATSTLTGTLDGWSQSIPTTDGNPCWVTSAQAAARTATVNIPTSAWCTPAKMAEDGEGGCDTYCQATAPTDCNAGDLWMDSDDNYKLYRYDGTQWVSVQDANIPDIIKQLTAAQSDLKVLNTSIEGTVTATYVTNQIDSLVESFNSALKLQADQLTASFEGTAQNAAGEVDTKFSTLIRASGDGVEIGKSGSNFKVLLTNDRLSFRQVVNSSEVEIAYMSNRKLFITDAQVTNELAFGSDGGNRFVWTKTSKGLSLRYVSA